MADPADSDHRVRDEACIVLAGGRGTRLHGQTGGANKHLLPLAGRPALAHVLDTVAHHAHGIIVTNPEAVDAVSEVAQAAGLADWQIVPQPAPDGTLAAVCCAIPLVETSSFVVHLGDNLFGWQRVPGAGVAFRQGASLEVYVQAIAKGEAARLAVAQVEGGRLVGIVEKPEASEIPEHPLVLTGFARFQTAIFRQYAPRVARSPRGEYEVPGLVELYLQDGLDVVAQVVGVSWLDYGTPESLRAAAPVLRAREETV